LTVKFAVVLHGPEVVDVGLAKKVIELLEEKGQVTAVMSGYTGVAAVIDAGLEGKVDISRMRKPSVELVNLSRSADFLLLVNHAKTRDSAMRFGSIVFSRCGSKFNKPLVQVDDGILIDWKGDGGEIARLLASELGLVPTSPSTTFPPKEIEDGWRSLGGVIPGENVWINGVVVGKATSENVRINKDGRNRIIARGIDLKETGVKRLGDFNVRLAHVRSGLTRRTTAHPRAIDSVKKGTYLIDHAAEKAVYECRSAALVVTIGDDTSKIAGALLYRFNVPVVSITDGDEDGISKEKLMVKGSVTIRVQAGMDDIVGEEVKQALFDGKECISGSLKALEAATLIMKIAGNRLISYKIAE
jgi:hypothetical protein